MIEREEDVIVEQLDDINGVNVLGDVVPLGSADIYKPAEGEREYPEADQETTRIDTRRPAYIPGPLENQVDDYKDRVSPFRKPSDKEACAECGINYEDFLAEQAASIAAMKAVDNFAAGSIVKANRNK